MNRSINSVSILVIFIIMALTILTGCSTASPNTPTTSAPTTVADTTQAPASVTSVADTNNSPTSPTTNKVYEFKYIDHYTPIMEDAQLGEVLGNLIEENTGGQVKITYYHAESLGKAADFINLLNGGVADIANCTPGNVPQSFAFFMGLEMPMLGFYDRAIRVHTDWELLKLGYQKEFDNFKVLAFNSTPAMNLFMKKNIQDIAGLQGAKIRASNPTMRNWLTNLGASPVAMSSSDVYMALERGTIDGVYTGYSNYLQQKFFEVCKYAIWNPINRGCSPIIMSKAAWNRLPPDVQVGVDKGIEEYKEYFIDYFTKVDAKAVD
ncbi:MAG: TRAP transporter substrate-binding protein DctP, partial [Dehalococcoidales bacterium]|nr:TRAP transporter substrate-binding protein DctP [Dehalococcoidales bacterium]